MAQVRGSAHVAATAVIIMVTMSMLFQSQVAEATVHKLAWNIQSYPTQNLKAGTKIYFQSSGGHDLVMVTKDGYDTCDKNKVDIKNKKIRVGVNFAFVPPNGLSYYICSVPGHCTAANMKVIVNAA